MTREALRRLVRKEAKLRDLALLGIEITDDDLWGQVVDVHFVAATPEAVRNVFNAKRLLTERIRRAARQDIRGGFYDDWLSPGTCTIQYDLIKLDP